MSMTSRAIVEKVRIGASEVRVAVSDAGLLPTADVSGCCCCCCSSSSVRPR
jgi:hypothetical protein